MLQCALLAALHHPLPLATLRLPPVYHRLARHLMTVVEDVRRVFAI